MSLAGGRRLSVLVCGACIAFVVFVVPALAHAVPPYTTVAYDPATPDGSPPWYVTAPAISFTSDQDGTLFYSVDGAPEQSLPATAGQAVGIGEVTEGVHPVVFYSANSLGATETPRNVTVYCDPTAPSRPETLGVTRLSGSSYQVQWTASADGMSGLDRYVIYRNSIGPSFAPQDEVGDTTGLTFLDAAPPLEGVWWYAVGALDNAGNLSALSDPFEVVADPPSAPGNVQAWLNSSGVSHVTWDPSVDIGSGVVEYRVYRSSGGAAFSLLDTVAAPATWLDDPSFGADPVLYYITAVDAVGFESAASEIATLSTDTQPPVAPGPLAVRPVFDPPGGGSYFDGTIPGVRPAASLFDRYEVSYGADTSASGETTDARGMTFRLGASVDATLWYFKVRAWDRAGNVSAWCSPVAARQVTTRRVSGADRYSNAVALSRDGFGSADTIVIASGLVFPDALSASSLAGAVHGPVLLVGTGGVRSDVRAEIIRLRATNAYVVGGTRTISGTTMSSIAALLSGTTRRLGGADRYATAALVAAETRRLRGSSPASVFLVSGVVFPDALSVAPAAYAAGMPVLYANPRGLPYASRAAIRASGATSTVIVGGTASVPRSVESLVPGPTRISGPDRYAVSRAVAGWATGRSVLGAGRPVLASGEVFPDGLAAGPVAGERGSIALLTNNARAASTGTWLAGYRAGMSAATLTGGRVTLTETTRRTIWSRLSVP